MRHLGSFLLAGVLAPIVYLLTGVGLSAFGQAAQRGVDERPLATVLALATLVVGGIVYAVLVMVRLSPVGPALAGFFFLGMPAWPLIDQDSYSRLLQDIGTRFELLGVQIVGIDLVGSSGLGVLLAVPLIATLASPRRWSRYDTRPAQVAYGGYPPQPYQQAVPYPQAAYPGPTRHATQPEPVTEQLPDVSPPTLHFPKYSAPVAVSSPPAAPTVVLPSSAPTVPAPTSAPPAPSQPAPAPVPPAPAPQPAPAPAPAPPAPAPQPAPAAPAPAAPAPAAPAPAPATPAPAPSAPAPVPPAPSQPPAPPVAPSRRAPDEQISVPRIPQEEPPAAADEASPAKPAEEPTVKIDPDTLKPI